MRAHRRERFQIPQGLRRTLYAAGVLCLASGSLWLVFHHFVRVEGTFGPQASPFEHPMLVAHGVTAFGLLWLFGALWLPHVRRAWHRRHNRSSGGTMATLMTWLAFSGLGLYYLGDEDWRAATSIGHWLAGLVAAAWLPIHIWRGRRAVHAHLSSGNDSR
jgi:hypothetical protein